jgi:hypothetical protein
MNKWNRITGNMEQEFGDKKRGCSSSHTLNISGERTSVLKLSTHVCIPELQFRMLSGSLHWIESLSGVPEWMDS